MSTLHRSIHCLVAAALLSSSGCAISQLVNRNKATNQMVQDAQARGEAAQHLKRTDLFVAADETWFCPTVEDTKRSAECEGGTRYTKNQSVTVIGLEPEAGLWKSEVWDAEGSHPGFLAAADLNELPDLAELDAFTADIDSRYSEDQRIPVQTVNYLDLVTKPKKFADRVLVIRQRSIDMDDKEFADGRMTFSIPIPGMQGAKHTVALALFEFSNAELVDSFQSGQSTYRCGPSYCDEFVIVAKLTGTTDHVDATGQLYRLPVFDVVELGDRYGSYQQQ